MNASHNYQDTPSSEHGNSNYNSSQKHHHKNNELNLWWKKIRSVMLIVIPAGLILYFAISFFRSQSYQGEYQVDFNKTNFQNEDLSLFINENPESAKFIQSGDYDNSKYAEIVGSPINLIFQPQAYLFNKKITFATSIKGEGDWEISTICDQCNSNEKYNFQPYYYGSINNYNLIRTIDDINFYSSDVTTDQYPDNNSIDDWIKKSIPENSSVRILNNDYPESKIINNQINFVPNSSIEVNYTLRGKHELFTYLSGKLDLEFVKRDLNKYEGSDEVSVTIYDMDNNIVKEIIAEDDGISVKDPNQVSTPISKRTEVSNILPAVYRIVFEDATDIAKNDWVIDKIKINSNKLVFSDYVYIAQPFNLYTENYEDKNLRTNVYDSKYLKDITLTDENNNAIVINQTDKDLYKSKDTNIPTGHYNISSNGNIVLNGFYFSLDQASYFNPFRYDLTKISGQKYVIGKYHYSKNDEWIDVSATFDQSSYHLFDNQIQFSLRNSLSKKQFEQETELTKNGLTFLTKLGDYKVYGQKKLKSYNESYDNLINWLKNSVPYGSSVDIGNVEDMSPSEFINNSTPEGFSNENINELTFSLRGTHEFLVYLKDVANFYVEKTDYNNYKGGDNVKMYLSDINSNEELCDVVIPDDGNESNDGQKNVVNSVLDCNNLQPRVYLLTIAGVPNIDNVDNDFVISKLSVNSNKIVIKDKIVNTKKIDLYANNNSDTKLNYYYWQENKDQNIIIDDLDTKKSHTIYLTKDDIKKNISDNLTKSAKSIHLGKGSLSVSGSNFAIKSSDWFNPYYVELRENENSDFVIIKSPYSEPVYIKSFKLNVD